MIQIGRAICRQLPHGNSSLAVSQAIMRQKPGVQPDMIVRLVAPQRLLTARPERSRSNSRPGGR
jgi:hypothetical protein